MSSEEPIPTDYEIAQSVEKRHIRDVVEPYGLDASDLELYGDYKAKVKLDAIDRLTEGESDNKLVLVTGMTPTPMGEGKTVTTVGLGQAFNRLGKDALVAIREPSLGPVFGIKGGAAGGGYSQVLPMEDINLHFTGDFHAITSAHNLLASLIDNHIHHGNELGFDLRRVAWRRVMDMNDRALRQITIGLGGLANGFVREGGFDITVASEVMAIFCLATDLEDLTRRLGKIVVGYTRDKEPITAGQLEAPGPMSVLLRDALMPNIVQTLENNPAFIHGGPFANIAHGCNSVMATKAGLKLADYTVTEAGSPNPHADITAEWTVSDADGDLASVDIDISESSETVSGVTWSLSGATASDTDSFEIKQSDGQTFDVTLTVTDSSGNSESASTSVTE